MAPRDASGRLPSCTESLEFPRTDMLRSGRSAERRDHAPVHRASSATLPPRSASVPTLARRTHLHTNGGLAARSPEIRLADFCNPHFKDEHPSQAWIPALITLDNRASSRRPIRFARPPPEPMAAVHRHGPGGSQGSDAPVARRVPTRSADTHQAKTISATSP
jgi:hypothetical protein